MGGKGQRRGLIDRRSGLLEVLRLFARGIGPFWWWWWIRRRFGCCWGEYKEEEGLAVVCGGGGLILEQEDYLKSRSEVLAWLLSQW